MSSSPTIQVLPALLPAPDSPTDESELLTALLARAQQFAAGARADSTLRAYRSDWRNFTEWCRERNLGSYPASPQTVVLYLTALSRTHKVATLTRRLSAISQVHQTAGFASPTEEASVRLVMSGIRRSLGMAAAGKRPVLVADLQAMVNAMPDNLLGLRDRALLLIGFSGAFRRSELVALDCEDLLETSEGLVVTLRRSKTDPEGAGRKVAIPRGREQSTCPLRASSTWMEAASIASGPVFLRINRHGQILPQRLSAEAVAIVVKRWAGKLGYQEQEFAGHSLRSGLATAAAIAGKSERSIMNQTGHRSLTTVRRYIRDGNLFRENAAEGLGL
jgi:site-specific recombinase XerD